jgi:NodT family efflux transporter outer membrane factor (OMF) lipoprotein
LLRSIPLPILALVLVAGCTAGPDWSPQSMWSPPAWQDADSRQATPSMPIAAPADPKWWTIFHDTELTSLEDRVAAANLNVRLATIRLVESRAQRRITGAGQFPTLNADGSYTHEEISRKGVIGLFSGASGGIPTSITGGTKLPPFNLWQDGFDASWELDLWGRVRREVEGADASVEASADARRGALVSVQAEIARDYMQLRGLQAQLAITRQNIATEQDTLDLTKDRLRGGLTTELDVANAAAQLQTTRAQVPPLEQQQAQSINALSLLLAEAPGALRSELMEPHPVPPVPPRVPVGVPSELARRRPDIRQAEAQLHAATATIGVAVADFYPKITLDGSIGLQALQFKDLGNWGARQYGLGPSVTLPIFQGGRLRATLDLRKVQQQEAALTYQQTVLQAWHDVDNALTAYATEQRRLDALAAAVDQNRVALDLSRQRYTQGLADFLNVLDAQRALLSAQLQLADSATTESANLVQLYKALGGGWESNFPVQTAKK